MGKKSIYDEKAILKYFTEKVLEIGYEATSIRMVASNFSMPVSSLYRHFESKEEMLDKALEPVIKIFNEMYDTYKKKTYEFLKMSSLEEIFDKQRNPKAFVDLMYKYPNEFKILLSHLKGTKYEKFADELVDYETEATIELCEALKKSGFHVKDIDYRYLRIITESNYNAYFAVVRNNLSYEEALDFLNIVSDYFMEGYKKILIGK